MINVDLKDFFPTVTYRRVKGLFAKLGYSEQVATVLGFVCSEPTSSRAPRRRDVLRRARAAPAPTRLSLPARRSRTAVPALDNRVAGYARARGLTYSANADDLTLSTKEAIDVGAVLGFIRHTVAAEGFAVHPDKCVSCAAAGDRR